MEEWINSKKEMIVFPSIPTFQYSNIPALFS
jgi:hypothetical protein